MKRAKKHVAGSSQPAGPSTVFTVVVQPRAARTEVVGPYGDAIKIRIQAPPVDGAANEELRRFLARRLRVAPSAVAIVGGASGRRKRVAVTDGPADPLSVLLRGD
jgi:uncharacterized protein (TIGR00251 family)